MVKLYMLLVITLYIQLCYIAMPGMTSHSAHFGHRSTTIQLFWLSTTSWLSTVGANPWSKPKLEQTSDGILNPKLLHFSQQI